LRGHLALAWGRSPASKARLYAAFPSMDLHFFDATTHPLGAADLSVLEDVAVLGAPPQSK
jgi:hypothetical protein